MDRRKFLRNAALGAAVIASPISFSAFGESTKRIGKLGRMKLSFEPYELKLRHSFNLAKYSRTTTPDVQVKLELDGLIGYGEASMPPYLGESVDSVTSFLSKLDLSQFSDPFRIEDIHDYMDSVAPDNRAAKASVDIALHDLLGKIMEQPWYKIWGLNPEKAPDTSFTIGIDKADVVKKKVDEAAPYNVLKVKMGLDNDKELVEYNKLINSKIINLEYEEMYSDDSFIISKESKLLSLYKEIYKDLYNEDIKEEICTGGIECSIIANSINNLDIISIGSTVNYFHTPEEETYISSWIKIYKILLELLNKIN